MKAWSNSVRQGAFAALLLTIPAHARNEEAPKRSLREDATRETDGVYDRFDGDLSLSAGGGVELDSPLRPRLLGTAALRYYSFVGVYAAYRQSLTVDDHVLRGLSTGVLFEPLFLWRWTRGSSLQSPLWDLALDSLGIFVGAHWEQPRGGRLGGGRGLEFGVGGGVPLLQRAQGPWLRVRSIWRSEEQSSSTNVIWLTLEWQGFLESRLTKTLDRHRNSELR